MANFTGSIAMKSVFVHIPSKRSLLHCIGIMSCLCIRSAYSQSLAESRLRLEEAVIQVKSAYARFPTRYQPSEIQRTGKVVDTLQTLVEGGLEPNSQDAYAKSLEFDAQLIERAIAAASQTESDHFLQGAYTDLELKVQFGRESLAAGPVLKSQVKIIAEAVDKDGNPVRGILFELSPVLYESTTPMFYFPSPAPTSGWYPPGRYVIKAINSNSSGQIIEAGLDGHDEQTVKVLVP